MGFKGWENFDPSAPRKAPGRQAQGRMSRELGKALEGRILAACEFYRAKQLAEIEKTPEPMKVLRPVPDQPGRFVCCFEKAAQPDFKGTIQGGRSAAFEAKATAADRIEQREVTDEQRRALDSHALMGAHTFVIVSLSLQTFYRVPWDTWSAMKEQYGRKYMTEEDLARYRIRVENGILRFLEN